MSFKDSGFTLIEVLIALVIFSVVLVASGKILTIMMKIQTESNIQMIVIDIMQSRLQEAAIVPVGTDACSDPALTASITIKIKNVNTEYFVACAKDSLVKGDITVEWPVLGASKDTSQAESCAKGISQDNCFIVGR